MVNIACNGIILSDIEAIFFDKDGTLEDSRLFLLELARERVKQIAIPEITDSLLLSFGIKENHLDPKGLMAVGSREENELAAAAYIASSGCGWFIAKDMAKEAFNKAAEKVIPTQKSSPIFPGSLEVLETLAEANLKLGIISADSTEGIQDFVQREKLESYFQLLLGSDTNLSKPDPLLYLKACKLLNVSAHKTLMIGDSLWDISMAQQANSSGTIGICWGSSQAKHLDTATVIIDNLAAIKVA